MSTQMTWDNVKTPKDFEEYILYHLMQSRIKDDLRINEDTTGKCEPCFDHRIRCCADIKGKYKDMPFVIDAKYYTSKRYISKDDIDKLEADMKNHEAVKGFILTFGGKISKEMMEAADKANIFIIHVRNNEENPTHWIDAFASKF